MVRKKLREVVIKAQDEFADLLLNRRKAKEAMPLLSADYIVDAIMEVMCKPHLHCPCFDEAHANHVEGQCHNCGTVKKK